MHVLTLFCFLVHGYSLLRTQLNNRYFLDIFDQAELFDIQVEGHRAWII